MSSKRKLLSVILVLLLCLSLAITASATSNFVIAGIYGKLHGSNTFEHGDLLELTATTRVSLNPDTAYLKIDAEYYSGSSLIDDESERSDRGDITMTKSTTLFYNVVSPITKIYYAHCVQGGSQSDQGYACYTSADIR